MFSPGDVVRTLQRKRPGHTRLPAYLQGKHGTVVSALGEYALPDAVSVGDRSKPRSRLYTVRFAAGEVWETASADAIYADLFEEYLERA